MNLFISHLSFFAEKTDFKGGNHKDKLERQRKQRAIAPLSACRYYKSHMFELVCETCNYFIDDVYN